MRRLTGLLICLLSSFSTPVFAGGGEWFSSFYIDNGYNILYPDLAKVRVERTKNFSPHVFTHQEYREKNLSVEVNVQAWSEFLQTDPERARAIIYDGKHLDTLDAQTRSYIELARQQEPLVNQANTWRLSKEEKKKLLVERTEQTKAMITTLLEKLPTTQSVFLKQRYLFLSMRLAHYSGQHQQAIDIYDQHQKTAAMPEGEVSQWIAALRAGALKRAGKTAEAAYEFAKVFANSASKKLVAQVNFQIKTDADWQELLALCKNNDEKALMHFMRAIKSNANSLQELAAIHQLAPNSDWLDGLLIRELEFVQFARERKPAPARSFRFSGIDDVNRSVLIDDIDRNKPSGQKDKLQTQKAERRAQYLADMRKVLEDIKTAKKREDLFLTDFASLYLTLLAGEAVTVQDVSEFQQQYQSDPRTPSAIGLEYLAYLKNLQQVDDKTEVEVSAYLEKLKPLYDNEWAFSENIMSYTYAALEPLYEKANQQGKAYIASRRGQVDLDEMIIAQIRDLRELGEKTAPNVLEKQMTAAMGQALSYPDPSTSSYEGLVARKYLAAGLFAKAAETLSTVDEKKLTKTRYNPFNTSLSGNNREKYSPRSPAQVVNSLIALSKQLKETPDDANAHFLLATAYYNMSWFGNSPMLTRVGRSTTNWRHGETDMSKAREHYEAALKHAPNREFKAKTLYALAKIEAIEVDKKLDANGLGRVPIDYAEASKQGFRPGSIKHMVSMQKAAGLGKYLGELKGFEDTDYHKDVIQQCADYRYFHAN